MTGREAVFRLGLIGLASASLVWAALPVARHMSGIVITKAQAPQAPPVAPQAMPPDLSALLALAPFGADTTLKDPIRLSTAETPDIVLRGIFAGRGAPSTALLDVAGTPGLYRQDMPVVGTLEVTRIARTFVELGDGETTLTLQFDEDTQSSVTTKQAEDKAVPSLLDRLQGGFVVADAYEKPSQPETTSEYIDYWRQRIRKNPKAVLDEIGLTPTSEGYVIAEAHDVGVRLAGLRTGDLVRRVNGQAVGNPDADTKFYDQIAATGQARIEVERGGELLSFSFPLR